MSGFVTGADTDVVNTDSVEVAIEKLQGQVDGNDTDIASNTTALSSKVDTTTTVNGNALSSNITLDTSDISENGNLYFTDARAIVAPLTGYSSAAGTVAVSDSVVGAMGKLNGNIAANSSSISGITSSQWTTNGSDVGYTAGNVGVGTTTPGSKLEVNTGNAVSMDTAIAISKGSAGTTYIRQFYNTSEDYGTLIGAGAAGSNLDALRIQFDTTTGSVDNVSIPNGNVGIGTVSPSAKLDVQGGNINTSGQVIARGISNYGGMYMPYRFTNDSSQQTSIVSWSDVLTFTSSTTGGAQTLTTSSSNYFAYQKITQVFVSCYFVGNSIYNSMYRLDFHNLYQAASVSTVSGLSTLLSVDGISFAVTGDYNSRQLSITIDANSSYAPNNHECYIEAKPFK